MLNLRPCLLTPCDMMACRAKCTAKCTCCLFRSQASVKLSDATRVNSARNSSDLLPFVMNFATPKVFETAIFSDNTLCGAPKPQSKKLGAKSQARQHSQTLNQY